jgi:hypothetical protein
MRGVLSNVWFNHYKISRDCLKHLESIDAMANSLGAVIQVEVRAGVPKHRMIIGTVSLSHTHTTSAATRAVLLSLFYFPVSFWLYVRFGCMLSPSLVAFLMTS